MKRINVYLTAAILLLPWLSFAQKNDKEPDKSQFKRLYIGDTVPMESIVFNKVRNYPGGKAKLSDFKGKHIILDFWDRHCTSCIAGFPKMEALQAKFKDDIQILLVTWNTEEELANLFDKSPIVKRTTLPIIIGEQMLSKKLFPYYSPPYHVWINKEGKVMASTNADETNVENLKSLIAENPLNMIIRYDIVKGGELYEEVNNKEKSLLLIGGGKFLNNLKYYAQVPLQKRVNSLPIKGAIPNLPYYSMFMSWLEGFPQMGFNNDYYLKDSTGGVKGFRIFNRSLTDLYWIALNQPYYCKVWAEGEAKLFYEYVTETTNLKRYLMSNGYCYESSIPNFNSEKARKLLQQDLARFFGLVGHVEKKPIKHIILIKLGSKEEENLWAKNQNTAIENYERGQQKDGYLIKGCSLQFLMTDFSLANRAMDDPLIIDETNFMQEDRIKKRPYRKIDILLKCESLHATPDNIPVINKELAKYGIGLKEEMRNVDVLVFRRSL